MKVTGQESVLFVNFYNGEMDEVKYTKGNLMHLDIEKKEGK